MDELDTIGFIPNGGRIYCMRVVTRMHLLISPSPSDLDRSQPPLFIQVYKSTSPNCSLIHTSEDVGALYHSKRRYQYSHSRFTFSRGEECRFPFPILSSEMTHRKSSNGGTITDLWPSRVPTPIRHIQCIVMPSTIRLLVQNHTLRVRSKFSLVCRMLMLPSEQTTPRRTQLVRVLLWMRLNAQHCTPNLRVVPKLVSKEGLTLSRDECWSMSTGWDYTVRWFLQGTNSTGGLRDLNVRSTVPVDLNSILCTFTRPVNGTFYSSTD